MQETKRPHPIILEEIDLHYTYDPDTGSVYKDGIKVSRRNRNRGTIYMTALVSLSSDNYLALSSICSAHHIAWYLTYGVWPTDKHIDHIDGDGTNNKLSNLRLVSIAQNQHNSKKNKNVTTSKYKGVSKMTYPKTKWRAYINHNDVRYNIGVYLTEDEAALAYNTKALELFGEYARLNIIGVGCP